MTKKQAVEKLLNVARGEIGYIEKASNAQLDIKTANAGRANYTKYARDLDNFGVVYNGKKNGFDWCDVFVDWCFVKAFGLEDGISMIFQPKYGAGAGCKYSMGFYKNSKRFFKTPEPGDQIFFTNDGGASSYHTGIVERVSGSTVFTIEGNTSGGSAVIANGGGVCQKSYTIGSSMIAGYGRPNYPDDEEDDMDIKKFKELYDEMLKDLKDNDAESYSAAARNWAVKNSLIAGGNKLPSGEPNYMWGDLMTREQFVTVLYRFAQMIGMA